MKISIFGLVFTLLFIGCTKPQPKIRPECKAIDCASKTIFYTTEDAKKHGKSAQILISTLAYVDCCGKQPMRVQEKK